MRCLLVPFVPWFLVDTRVHLKLSFLGLPFWVHFEFYCFQRGRLWSFQVIVAFSTLRHIFELLILWVLFVLSLLWGVKRRLVILIFLFDLLYDGLQMRIIVFFILILHFNQIVLSLVFNNVIKRCNIRLGKGVSFFALKSIYVLILICLFDYVGEYQPRVLWILSVRWGYWWLLGGYQVQSEIGRTFRYLRQSIVFRLIEFLMLLYLFTELSYLLLIWLLRLTAL